MIPRIVVCASGEGSNFQAIVEASRQGRLWAEVVGLLVNRPKIGALGRADRLGVPTALVAAKSFASRAACDAAVLSQLRVWRADWVVLAGYLALIGPQTLAAFPKRIVNSHPALLPKYGGPGMYGDHVHRAVLAAGELETGITVHLIDEEYDRGDILAQLRIPVKTGDTPEVLAARVKAAENSFYPKVLNDLVTGRATSG